MINSKILLSRYGEIASSKEMACNILNERTFSIGEPAVVRYYVDEENNIIDSLVVLGIKDGKGPDCYTITNPGNFNLLTRVDRYKNPPDVSELLLGQVILYQNTETNKWYLCKFNEENNERVLEEISQKPLLFLDMNESVWYISREGSRDVFPIYDLYSTGEIDAKVNELKKLIDAASGNEGFTEIIDDITNRLEKLEQNDQDYVKTITINGGDVIEMDENGNVNLVIEEGGGEDERVTDDMIEYLNAKLNYTYKANCTVSPSVSSITFPSNISSVDFTANFSMSKTNDMGTSNVEIKEVSNVTSGWSNVSGSITKYEKSVSVDPQKTNVSSGNISATVVPVSGKTVTSPNASSTVQFNKPWFIFEAPESVILDDMGTLSNTKATELIENLLKDDVVYFLKDTKAYPAKETTFNIKTFENCIWFAIPNTRGAITATQLGQSVLNDNIWTASSSIGSFKLYRTEKLLTGDISINVSIK